MQPFQCITLCTSWIIAKCLLKMLVQLTIVLLASEFYHWLLRLKSKFRLFASTYGQHSTAMIKSGHYGQALSIVATYVNRLLSFLRRKCCCAFFSFRRYGLAVSYVSSKANERDLVNSDTDIDLRSARSSRRRFSARLSSFVTIVIGSRPIESSS